MSHTTDNWEDEQKRGLLEGLHSAHQVAHYLSIAVFKADVPPKPVDGLHSATDQTGDGGAGASSYRPSPFSMGHPENWCMVHSKPRTGMQLEGHTMA